MRFAWAYLAIYSLTQTQMTLPREVDSPSPRTRPSCSKRPASSTSPQYTQRNVAWFSPASCTSSTSPRPSAQRRPPNPSSPSQNSFNTRTPPCAKWCTSPLKSWPQLLKTSSWSLPPSQKTWSPEGTSYTSQMPFAPSSKSQTRQ